MKLEIERNYYNGIVNEQLTSRMENLLVNKIIEFYSNYARSQSVRYAVSRFVNISDEAEAKRRAYTAVHDAILILLSKIKEGTFDFDEESGFGKFMMTTIKYRIMNQRSRKEDFVSIDELVQVGGAHELGHCEIDSNNESISVEKRLQFVNRRAQELLSEKQYELFRDGYLEGYDNEELAVIHNYNHHRTACKKLSQAKANFICRLTE